MDDSAYIDGPIAGKKYIGDHQTAIALILDELCYAPYPKAFRYFAQRAAWAEIPLLAVVVGMGILILGGRVRMIEFPSEGRAFQLLGK